MLQEKINNDLKQAMKNRDTVRVSCLRMVIADMKNKKIAKGKDLTDEDITSILQKQVKQHKDSIESFKTGNRQDLVDTETKELEIIQSYLPEQLGEDEITQIAKQTIEETAVSGRQDMGKVMGVLMPKLKGRADGKLTSRIVSDLLMKNEQKQ